MPDLPSVRSRECIKALKKVGFYEVRQRGGHLIMRRDEPHNQTTVPIHNKPLTPGTLRNIIKQTGLTVEEFLELL